MCFGVIEWWYCSGVCVWALKGHEKSVQMTGAVYRSRIRNRRYQTNVQHQEWSKEYPRGPKGVLEHPDNSRNGPNGTNHPPPTSEPQGSE